MNPIRISLLAAAVLFSTQVMATNSQQDKMTSCNADAKTKALSGDARKTFMSTCLSASAPAPAASVPATQQDKMKTCNADATAQSLKGDARKSYMSTCLKK
ncbi:PsiF family protein [Silvimonas soli]|uniref:PsiF family protein n=1 Tax=Silvimonas soli TaxID=2980100 RepID=UPI0024B39D32|nr:PsiF family protein [Silvimonas soli]